MFLNQLADTTMKTFLLASLIASMSLINLEVQADPLGQGIKEILQSELDRADAMAAKMDLIRSQLENRGNKASKPETSEFLQVIRAVNCEDDPGALMRSIDSDIEASVAYVISGRCVIDRFVEIIGKAITISSSKSSLDPLVTADELATLVIDTPERVYAGAPANSLNAAPGSTVILYDLFLESAADKPLALAAFGNASLTLFNVGFRGQMYVVNYRGAHVLLLDWAELRNFIGQQATQSQLGVSATRKDWNINWNILEGASARVYGSYNSDFRMETGASLMHLGFPENSAERSVVNYQLSAGSVATIINLGFDIGQIKAQSNSTVVSLLPLNPDVLQVSPSSFVGRMED